MKFLIPALAAVALMLSGCAHKPTRPTPDQTMMGPKGGPGGDNLAFSNVASTLPDGLAQRDPNDAFGPDGQLRGKLDAVYFDYDRFDIKPAERTKLQAAAQYLKDHADQRLLLEGRCDWHGTAEYNLGLGDRRANAVKRYLGTIGVPADKIEQILLNLVENGVRHGAGTVSIVIEPCEGGAAVSVRDEGQGIAPETIPRVFRQFWRSKRRSGTGLGLFIVKGLVEAHGGTITVGRAPSGGAEFRFTMPAGAPEFV